VINVWIAGVWFLTGSPIEYLPILPT
jgi:hypothetical protein